MSSPRLGYNRKRRSDDESSSSDSDEDGPPIKRSREWNRESNIKDIITSKFHNLVNWIYHLPVGYYEKENMLKNTIHVPIEIEDDEDDIDVVEIDDDDLVIEDNISDKPLSRDNLLKDSPISMVTDPHSSSTPFYKDYRSSKGRTLNSLSRRSVNGRNSSVTSPTKSKRLSLQHQKLRRNHCHAPLTNPSSEVEILLDTREIPCEESDDLEIVSEIPNAKSSRLTRQTVSQIGSNFSQTPRECNGISQSSTENGKAASIERQGSSNKSYTAHEVIRLQEKAHYQLILDKMVGTSIYHPAVPKKPAEIQVDLTKDDDPALNSCLKKEILDKPVNEFLLKYYKPCHFKPCAPPDPNYDIETITVDDDVQDTEIKTPVSYRPKANKKPDIFSTEWINELKKTITLETEQRLQVVAAQEEKVERYRKRRDAKILKEKLLRGQSISSDQAEKDEFPDLTPDMEERIDSALGCGSAVETLSTFKDCVCTRSDITTLAGLNWLNDSVINFYLALVTERNKNNPAYPRVFAFNSFFYSSLKTRGPKAVMRWTRKLEDGKNLFQFDIIFVPLHLGVHWALCVIDNRTKKIKYYDSMSGSEDKCLKILLNYLVFEKQDKLQTTLDPNSYSLEIVKDIPQQMNGSDCGMFTLKYAEYLSRDAPITFSQEHMQYFRRRLVIEILDKKLI